MMMLSVVCLLVALFAADVATAASSSSSSSSSSSGSGNPAGPLLPSSAAARKQVGTSGAASSGRASGLRTSSGGRGARRAMPPPLPDGSSGVRAVDENSLPVATRPLHRRLGKERPPKLDEDEDVYEEEEDFEEEEEEEEDMVEDGEEPEPTGDDADEGKKEDEEPEEEDDEDENDEEDAYDEEVQEERRDPDEEEQQEVESFINDEGDEAEGKNEEENGGGDREPDTTGDNVDTTGDNVDTTGDNVDTTGDNVDTTGDNVDTTGDNVGSNEENEGASVSDKDIGGTQEDKAGQGQQQDVDVPPAIVSAPLGDFVVTADFDSPDSLPSAYKAFALRQQMADFLLAGFRENYSAAPVQSVELEVEPVVEEGGEDDDDDKDEYRVSGALYLEASEPLGRTEIVALQESLLREMVENPNPASSESAATITGFRMTSSTDGSGQQEEGAAATPAAGGQNNDGAPLDSAGSGGDVAAGESGYGEPTAAAASEGDGGSNPGPIAAGVLFALASVAGVLGMAVFLRRRRSRSLFYRPHEEDDDSACRIVLRNSDETEPALCDIETESVGGRAVVVTSAPSVDAGDDASSAAGGENAPATAGNKQHPETVMLQKLLEHYASKSEAAGKASLLDQPVGPEDEEAALASVEQTLEDNPLPSGGGDEREQDEVSEGDIPPIRPCGSLRSMETLETVEEEQEGMKGDDSHDKADGTSRHFYELFKIKPASSQPQDAQSQDDASSTASSVAGPNAHTTSALAKYMPSIRTSKSQEEYLSDSEPQIFGADTRAPSAISMVHDDDQSGTSTMQLLAGNATFSDDEDDCEFIRKRESGAVRDVRKATSIFKNCSPTSCLDTTNPKPQKFGTDGEGTDDDDEDDPLRTRALAVDRDGGGGTPYDESLEDQNDLERFAEELEKLRDQVRLIPSSSSRAEITASSAAPREQQRQAL